MEADDLTIEQLAARTGMTVRNIRAHQSRGLLPPPEVRGGARGRTGYYKQDRYGIRIENLVLIREPETIAGGERPMMAFETLTLCPIDRRLIEPALLSPEELDWLNAYHARVLREIGPFLEGVELKWLQSAGAPITR